MDVKRVLREIAILRHLDHPNIIKLRDCAVDDNLNKMYMVTEVCSFNLEPFLEADVKLTEHKSNSLLYRLLCGLKYLHLAGVWHLAASGRRLRPLAAATSL